MLTASLHFTVIYINTRRNVTKVQFPLIDIFLLHVGAINLLCFIRQAQFSGSVASLARYVTSLKHS